VIFPSDFFKKFKENAKDQTDPAQAHTDPAENPPLPFYAFELDKGRTKDKFVRDILKINKKPYGRDNKYNPQN